MRASLDLLPPSGIMQLLKEVAVSHLSPQTLTYGEQKGILKASSRNPRDHLIYSLALGTGLRLAEIVGLNVGDVYLADGKPRSRIPLCANMLETLTSSSLV